MEISEEIIVDKNIKQLSVNLFNILLADNIPFLSVSQKSVSSKSARNLLIPT